MKAAKRDPEIRWRILRLDEGGGGALVFGKSQSRRLIDAGIENFTRQWTLGNFTVQARCTAVYDEYQVRLSVVGRPAPLSIGYLAPSPWANSDPAQFPQRASPVAALTPYTLSSALPSQNPLDTGVPDDAKDLQATYGVATRYVYLSQATFSDDEARVANVAGVLGSPLYRNCTGRVTTASEAPDKPAPSSALFSRLFDARLGAFLASYADGAEVTVQTPASLAGVLNSYVDLRVTPVYFWKDDAGEVWSLCRLAPLDGSSTISESNSPQLMPFTGDLAKDLYVADDLVGSVIDRAHPPAAGAATQLAQATIYDALPCIMLKVRMIDLCTVWGGDPAIGSYLQKQTVNAAGLGTSVQFPVFDFAAIALVNPPVADGVVDSSRDVTFTAALYRFTVRFAGAVSTLNGSPAFSGNVFLTAFSLNLNVWGVVTRIPDGQMVPAGKVRTGFDIQASRETYGTNGAPFSAGELVDLRPLMWPTRDPSYVTIGSNGGASQVWSQSHNTVIYDQVLTPPDPVTGTPDTSEWKELSATIWAGGFFTGLYFLVSNFKRDVLPAGSTSDRLLAARWGNIASVAGAIAVAFTDPGTPILELEDTAPATTRYTRLGHEQLVREHRGALVTLGSLDDMAELAGDPKWFIPSVTGLTEFHSDATSQPFAPYGALVHAEAGYVETFPALFSFPPAGAARMGRSYKGVPLEDAVFVPSAGMSVSPIRSVEDSIATSTDPLLRDRTFTYANSVAANDPVSPPFPVDVIEYPSASPFYAPASSGGTLAFDGRSHLPYYKGIALYRPNLRDGKPGFCLLKLGPDERLVRVIYYLLPYTVAGLPALVGYTAKLRDHISFPIYNTWPAYAAAIAALATKASQLAGMPPSNPPGQPDLDALKALAGAAVRASYMVLVNNFAPPEMTDLFVESVVLG